MNAMAQRLLAASAGDEFPGAADDARAAPWLHERRCAGRAAWAAGEFPNRKFETWKYTRLRALEREFAAAQPGADKRLASLAGLYVDGSNIPLLEGPQLVFVNGFPRDDLSNFAMNDNGKTALPEGLELLRFADASAQQAAAIRDHLGQAADNRRHPFAQLSDAALRDGVFLRIKAGTALAEPVHLVWLSSAALDNGATAPTTLALNHRLLIVAEENTSACIIEHFGGEGSAFTNGITELILQPGVRVEHGRLHLETGDAMHIGGVHAALERDSSLSSFHLAFGSVLKRIDIAVAMRGPGAQCELNGIYLLQGREHTDYHTCVEHEAPHCHSDAVFRGIIGGEAVAVFNGRIHIHPGAQKTRAELNNRNLLASADAEVNAKPELEIYADDVQCAHGATVAQLDPDMLHYLRARGLSASDAQAMLSRGFINEVLAAARPAPLQDALQGLLARRLGDTELTGGAAAEAAAGATGSPARVTELPPRAAKLKNPRT